jgi:sorbitol-specific phosphotransferase system component IIA
METMRVKSRSGVCLIHVCVARKEAPRSAERIGFNERQACHTIVEIHSAAVKTLVDVVHVGLVLQGVTRLRIISFVRLSKTGLGESTTTVNAIGKSRKGVAIFIV